MIFHPVLKKAFLLLICCSLIFGFSITQTSFAEEESLPYEITPKEHVTPEQEARFNELLKFWLYGIVGEDPQLSFSRVVNLDENGNRYVREDVFIAYITNESIGRYSICLIDQDNVTSIIVEHPVDESERFPRVEMTEENIAERFDSIYKSHVNPAFFDKAIIGQRVIEYDSWYWDENEETIFQQYITLKSDETFGQFTYPAGTTIGFQLYSNRLSNTLPQIEIRWQTETN